MPESSVDEAAERLAGLLPEDALQDALQGLEADEITGPGGLVSQLAGRVIETALGAELTEHLGYPPGAAPPGCCTPRCCGRDHPPLVEEVALATVTRPGDTRGRSHPVS